MSTSARHHRAALAAILGLCCFAQPSEVPAADCWGATAHRVSISEHSVRYVGSVTFPGATHDSLIAAPGGFTITIVDDLPSISVSQEESPALVVDETNLGIDASANFAGLFTSAFGADGPDRLVLAVHGNRVVGGAECPAAVAHRHDRVEAVVPAVEEEDDQVAVADRLRHGALHEGAPEEARADERAGRADAGPLDELASCDRHQCTW